MASFLKRGCLLVGIEGFGRLGRVVPKAPSLVGHSFNPVCFGSGVGDAARASLLSLFRPLGLSPAIPEDTLEARVILATMGQT